MVDLSAKPFNLDRERHPLVHRIIDSMTLEEKVGQLFIKAHPSWCTCSHWLGYR